MGVASSGRNGPRVAYIEPFVVRAPAGRSLPAPGSFCKTRRISQTAQAYSGAVLILICCAPEQTTDTKRRGDRTFYLPSKRYSQILPRITVRRP